jgi:hypothetical protein
LCATTLHAWSRVALVQSTLRVERRWHSFRNHATTQPPVRSARAARAAGGAWSCTIRSEGQQQERRPNTQHPTDQNPTDQNPTPKTTTCSQRKDDARGRRRMDIDELTDALEFVNKHFVLIRREDDAVPGGPLRWGGSPPPPVTSAFRQRHLLVLVPPIRPKPSHQPPQSFVDTNCITRDAVAGGPLRRAFSCPMTTSFWNRVGRGICFLRMSSAFQEAQYWESSGPPNLYC